MTDAQDRRRALPSVDRLLGDDRAQALLARFSRPHVTRRCREVLDRLRDAIRNGPVSPEALDAESILNRLERRLAEDTEPTLTRVVNATGTILHTNLGRAPLPPAAVDALAVAAAHPVDLEYDLDRGERGRREAIVSQLLVDLTGAEAATVVNNNAAALLLCLNTLAEGREVIVSRGELIEIGGAFRLPEIMGKSGAILKEVGTTNRTHPHDYEQAIGNNTGLLLKVHTSNYRIVGFSSEVGLADLVAIGRRHGVRVLEDLGSGALVDLTAYGLPKEPVVAERIALGADLVTFSGDKVLGGPQSGLIAGARDAVEAISSNPLHRAVRCGKLTIAALEATLRLYRQTPAIEAAVPVLKALARPLGEIDELGRSVLRDLAPALGPEFDLSLEDGAAQIGSGALPTAEIPSKVIAVTHPRWPAERIAERFRAARPPILGRVRNGRFLLDLRTVFDPSDLIPSWPGG
jgi:L-seryl-tRNA(Ser) seleniumtransferase